MGARLLRYVAKYASIAKQRWTCAGHPISLKEITCPLNLAIGKTLFAQTMEFILWTSFARIVAR